MLQPHPAYNHILKRVSVCRDVAISWQGIVYRSVSMRFASTKDILSGIGSLKNGARWTGMGSFRAVYASDSPETAMAETLAHYRYYGIPIAGAMPRVFVAIDVSLQCVLDLTNGAVRRSIGVSRKRMIEEDWHARQDQGIEAVTQAVGHACHAAGFEGIQVPSAASPSGFNMVIFPANLRAGSTVAVMQLDLPGG